MFRKGCSHEDAVDPYVHTPEVVGTNRQTIVFHMHGETAEYSLAHGVAVKGALNSTFNFSTQLPATKSEDTLRSAKSTKLMCPCVRSDSNLW